MSLEERFRNDIYLNRREFDVIYSKSFREIQSAFRQIKGNDSEFLTQDELRALRGDAEYIL